MNLSPSATADAFADAARRAIRAAGGADLARRAQADPALRTAAGAALLDHLGVGDMDVRYGQEAATAAAELCRVAGMFAWPYPVAALLAAPLTGGWRFLALVDEDDPWVDHGDLPGPWLVIDSTGRPHEGEAVATRRNRTLAPFAVPVRCRPVDVQVDDLDRALVTTFDAFTVLGALERAHALTLEHTRTREQFGNALAKFQGVQFRIADCSVAVRGLRRLAHFTLWRLFAAPHDALVDALALRVYTLETANLVLGNSHLLHGAVGFCDEHDLTTLDRAVQASLRLPTDLEQSTEMLTAAIDAKGFHGLFDPRDAPSDAPPDGPERRWRSLTDLSPGSLRPDGRRRLVVPTAEGGSSAGHG